MRFGTGYTYRHSSFIFELTHCYDETSRYPLPVYVSRLEIGECVTVCHVSFEAEIDAEFNLGVGRTKKANLPVFLRLVRLVKVKVLWVE